MIYKPTAINSLHSHRKNKENPPLTAMETLCEELSLGIVDNPSISKVELIAPSRTAI
jgi:hypothetical protein